MLVSAQSGETQAQARDGGKCSALLQGVVHIDAGETIYAEILKGPDV